MKEKEWIDIMVKKYQMSAKVKKKFIANCNNKDCRGAIVDKDDLHADYSLLGCFIFQSTPEGSDYWWDIEDKLKQRK